ncbi:MAG: Ig-like domain-containing protein, partial [Gammaproteobacteria bacterium]
MAVGVVACDGGTEPPDSPPIASSAGLTITPAIVELAPGGTHTLQATVRDEAGAVVPTAVIVWRSANASVASVTATGAVTAVAVGNADIIATSNGLSDTAE